MDIIYWVITTVLALVAAGAGYFLATRRMQHIIIAQSNAAAADAQRALDEARRETERLVQQRAQLERECETLRREASLQAREEAHKILELAEQEAREKRAEILKLEQRLLQREELLEHRFELLEQKEHTLMEREALLTKKQGELRELMHQRRFELERISGMSAEQARELLLKEVRDELEHEAAILARQIEEDAKRDAERRAREVILDTVQRCVVEHVAQNTITVIHLPSEDIKGRIIGREGRNIRHFEHITGVDVIVDDTPEAVVLSSFEPIRREIARITLLNLIHDGRIHPARIEEEYERAKSEVERRIWQTGEEAVLQVGLTGVHPEIVRTLGKLRYRTSYAQNVLDHSIEVATLAGLIAAELKLDTRIVKRAALFHDIGKALENTTEGTARDCGHGVSAPLRRERNGVQRGRRAPPRHYARQLGGACGDYRRLHLGGAPGRTARIAAAVPAPLAGAGAHRHELRRCGEGVRHSGGTRGARAGQAERGGRPARPPTRPRNRAQNPVRTGVSRTGQGDGHSRGARTPCGALMNACA
jgi:ribonuclease Y